MVEKVPNPGSVPNVPNSKFSSEEVARWKPTKRETYFLLEQINGLRDQLTSANDEKMAVAAKLDLANEDGRKLAASNSQLTEIAAMTIAAALTTGVGTVVSSCWTKEEAVAIWGVGIGFQAVGIFLVLLQRLIVKLWNIWKQTP